MGATWSIHSETDAECLALSSEGAPAVSLSYGSSAMVAEDSCGLISWDREESYWFEVAAEDCAAVFALFASSSAWQKREVAEVCRVAHLLGRSVSAA